MEKFFRWSLFSKPVKGTYVYVSRYIIFSEEQRRTRHYPLSALLDILGWLRKWNEDFPPGFLVLFKRFRPPFSIPWIHFALAITAMLCAYHLRRLRGQTSNFRRFPRRSLAKKLADTLTFLLSIWNVCVSHVGGPVWRSLFLESVRTAIPKNFPAPAACLCLCLCLCNNALISLLIF